MGGGGEGRRTSSYTSISVEVGMRVWERRWRNGEVRVKHLGGGKRFRV